MEIKKFKSAEETFGKYLAEQYGHAYTFEEVYVGDFEDKDQVRNYLNSQLEDKLKEEINVSNLSDTSKKYFIHLIEGYSPDDYEQMKNYGIPTEYLLINGHLFYIDNVAYEVSGTDLEEYLIDLF
jgi:hypothetical protein